MKTQAEDTLPQRGASSAVSPLTEDLIRADSKPLTPALQAKGNYMPKPRRIDMSRYHDPAFAALERERLWGKVWQYACREEDIPNVGDRITYDVRDLSFIITRSAPGVIKAFYNSCRHRGTRLVDGFGVGDTFRCPFHGWEWKVDGSLHNIPSRWDFPKATDHACRLPEAKVATWGGFIFINPDPDAQPFEALLGVLPEHFRAWEPERHFTFAHVRKLIRANWKVTMEAFFEAYHVIETHSDSLPFVGDASTQYDIWDDGTSHISRLITPTAVPSPHLGDQASVQAALQGTAMMMAMAMGPGVAPPTISSSSIDKGRAEIAEWRRKMMGAALARDFSALPDAELVDTIQYWMFPNFCPWYGEGLPLVYQFLPYGDDPNLSIMNIRILAPVPGGGAPRPSSAPIVELGFDEHFADRVPEFGYLQHIFDQDMGNLPNVQRGLHSASADKAQVMLGRYQECRITHFHEVLDQTLGLAS
jgi:phenylpropionate dioxygenase-like ring-hydroxylating dioxygenase large terminal subunit